MRVSESAGESTGVGGGEVEEVREDGEAVVVGTGKSAAYIYQTYTAVYTVQGTRVTTLSETDSFFLFSRLFFFLFFFHCVL